MTIKWSEFGDYDATGDITQNTGVGLQAGLNVRWPAWYLSSSESVTTGASPININPEVFHTKVTTGGTGGTEVLNFLSADAAHTGRPHLVTLDSITNNTDVVSITADDLNVTPFNNGVLSDLPTNVTSLTLNDQDDAVLLSWGHTDYWGDTWLLQQYTGSGVNLQYQTTSQNNAALDYPTILFQDSDGTYNAVDDPQNPNFSYTLIASTDPNNPAIIPAMVRYVIIDTASHGAHYVSLDTPNASSGSSGLQKVIVYGTIANSNDTVIFDNSLRNQNGNFFNQFQLDQTYRRFTCHWDTNLGWLFDGAYSPDTDVHETVKEIWPQGQSFLISGAYPYAIVRGDTNYYDVSEGQNQYNFSSEGFAEVVSLPNPRQTGFVYTFSVQSGSMQINLLANTSCLVGGNPYSATAPTFSSSQIGATISFRDVGSPVYVVESITGAWTITTTNTTAPSFVNAASYTTASAATTIAPALPGGRVNGNVLMAWCRVQSDGDGATNITLSAGWTLLSLMNTSFAQFHGFALAYAYVTGAETAPTFTLTKSGAGTFTTIGAQVIQYTGALASPNTFGRVAANSWDGFSSVGGFHQGDPPICAMNAAANRCSTIVSFALYDPASTSGGPTTPFGMTSRSFTANTLRIMDATSTNGSACALAPLGVTAGPLIMTDHGVATWTMVSWELRSQ